MNGTEQSVLQLSSERTGTGDETLILLHGYGVSRKSWYDLVPLLGEDYDIHMIDLMGFGDSPAPRNWDYSIVNQSRAVFRYLIDNNLRKISIIAHSYGAAVAILLMRLVSGIDTVVVEKLILIGPATYHQKLPFFLLIPSVPFLNLILRVIPAHIQVWFVLQSIFWDASLIDEERISRYVANLKDRHRRKALIKVSQQIVPNLSDKDIDAILSGFDLPVLLIYGEEDNVIPANNIYRLRDILDQARLVVVRRCGHSPHEESPLTVSQEVKYFMKSGS